MPTSGWLGWKLMYVAAVTTLATSLVLVGGGPSGRPGLGSVGTRPYTLPATAFDVTDHNLTYAVNGFFLAAVIPGSFAISLENDLTASGRVSPELTEAQIGIGPVPAGPDETNITPLIIVQEAASGLLRIEYIPFPMNDTYGYIVFNGLIVPAGGNSFAGHLLTIYYNETAPPVPPYLVSRPYGQTTGNLTVEWDGHSLVPRYPIAWSSFGAFYAYGLKTDGFAGGAVFSNVTTLAPDPRGSALASPVHEMGFLSVSVGRWVS
ncbi:MAG TPA: hypothetical protein VFG07_03015 [Thermoplasmata archaeon]|nr:hypothetical protein [Thermoplasmata archaeon]